MSNYFIYAMTLVSSGFIHLVEGQGVFAEKVHGRSINKSVPRTMQDCTSVDFPVEVVICLFGGFLNRLDRCLSEVIKVKSNSEIIGLNDH